VVLLEQPYIRDESRRVRDVLAEAVARLGENIRVRRFARFRVGE
jgi:elongation factor Ts